MKAATAQTQLQQLRTQLAALTENFILDDISRGLLAKIRVSGGVFLHPVHRQAITSLTVYGAGCDRVKIIEPRFLWSLPWIPLTGLDQPADFCARVAKQLSEALDGLGQLREQIAAMGIHLEMDPEILRLRGQLHMQGRRVAMTADPAQALVVTALGPMQLTGIFPRSERSLELTGQATADLDQLAALIRRIDDGMWSETIANMEQHLGDWESASNDAPAAETDEVLELTDMVEEAPTIGDPLSIQKLLQKLGSKARVRAAGGKLQIQVDVKVMQGNFSFFLGQQQSTRFQGTMRTPSGSQHQVRFDLDEIEDLVQVLEQVLNTS